LPGIEELKEYGSMLEAITRNSDNANRRLKNSSNAITTILDFLNEPTKEWEIKPEFEIQEVEEDGETIKKKIQIVEGVKTEFLKQYDPKHQNEITKPLLIIEHDLSGILPITLNLRVQYYQLEPNRQPPMLMPGYTPPQQVFTKPPGIFSRVFNRVATTINDLQSPYQMSIEPIQSIENIEQIVRKWLDYHQYGIIKQRRLTKERMELYLLLEQKYFVDTVMVSIMKVIGEASRLVLEKEQELISSIIASKRKEDLDESRKQ